MKRNLLFLAALTVVFALAACNQAAQPTTQNSAEKTTASQTISDQQSAEASIKISEPTASQASQTITEVGQKTVDTVDSSQTSKNLLPMTKEKQLAAPVKGDTVAIIDTTEGVVKAKIFVAEVPNTSKNFIELAKQGKYKNVPFHRVIKDFMIQTGDFENQDGTGGYSAAGPGTNLNDELIPGFAHLNGTLSMAKTARPNSAGSQFFIVSTAAGTPWLDGVHSIFGQVYEGLDIVKKIESTQTDSMDRPEKAILIKDIKIETL